MAELRGPATGLSVHRLRAVLAYLRSDCILHTDDEVAVERDPGATLTDGKLRLTVPAVAMEYLVERHGWNEAFADRLELRARERAGIAGFDAIVIPAFEASLRCETLSPAVRKRMVTELRELSQTAHATGYRLGNALSLWLAPAWLRMQMLRDASPVASMVGEWMELGGWLDAAAEQSAVRETAPDRARVQAELTSRAAN